MPRRKVDVVAGSHGSLANRLKRRRELLEGGNPAGARKVMTPKKKGARRKKGY